MPEDIKKYLFKKGLPVEFEVANVEEKFNAVKTMLNTPHRTNFYHIIWNQVGTPKHLIDFKPVELIPGSLLFLNKDTVQKFDVETYNVGKVILFTDNFYCQTKEDTEFIKSTPLFNDLFSVSNICINRFSDSVTFIFNMMMLELKNDASSYQSAVLRNLLSNLLLISERELQEQGSPLLKKNPEIKYLLNFKNEIELRYKSLKQVSRIAEHINISTKKLNQLTSKILGKSPKQMIDERVLLEAKRLLVHSAKNVKEIAFELGFDEPTNFIKYFKKHVDSTPVEFRDKFIQ